MESKYESESFSLFDRKLKRSGETQFKQTQTNCCPPKLSISFGLVVEEEVFEMENHFVMIQFEKNLCQVVID